MNKNNEELSEEEIYRSIVNLKRSNNTNFDTFVNWLGRFYYETQKRNQVEKDDVGSRWGQGKLQMLDYILKQIENAEARLEDLTRKNIR